MASPGASGSLGANNALVLIQQAPTISNVSSTNENGLYKFLDDINISVRFFRRCYCNGNTQIRIRNWTRDNNMQTIFLDLAPLLLIFSYTVQANDLISDLDFKSTSALALNSGTIKDAAGNDAVLTLATPGDLVLYRK